ncbi:MAG: PAS domain S-box protein [Burkholderiales bacterium]|nr:PAS domain S-box protein [Burkholderiales bacterium]
MNREQNESSAEQTHILIVEDSPVGAELLRRALDKAGYRVIVAKNGREGLLAVHEHRPNLVVSDIRMPLMSGYELCRQIKYDEALWDIPVILLTVLSEPEDIMEAINSGADSYIIKPFNESILLERVRALMAMPIRRKRRDERRWEEVEYNGMRHKIMGGSQQILNLLLSIYQNTLAQNRELADTQAQLRLLIESLDEQVRARTEALSESEEKFRSMSGAVLDAVLMVDGDGRLVYWNPAAERIFGYRAEEVLGRDVHQMFAPPRYLADFERGFAAFRETGTGPIVGKTQELEALHKDGSEFPVELSVSALKLHERWHAVGILHDITERKRAERALKRSNRALMALSACNAALIHADNETSLLGDMCRVIVEQGGYRFAWIGFVEHDEAKSVRPVAHAGFEEGYLESARITWSDTERGRGPTGRAVRSGIPQAARDIGTDPLFAPWRMEALKRGYASSLVLPLKAENGTVFGALSIYSAEADAFDEDELRLLEELADDLAFGILTLRTRFERNQAVKGERDQAVRLRHALEETIAAIALTLEKRDPYTAGHQQRVAAIAAAIAREMGLPPHQVEGIHFGALIHDIGKVYVPSEILNRPGKLTDLEFALIKSHPEVGFDIVKDIPFPWPVAQMVRQHHERLDGSGYPQGLENGAIMLEARILAVADTVEAMAAHRPYRAALGLDAAMNELERERGKTFDPEVVDVCLRMVREKGFALPGEYERLV